MKSQWIKQMANKNKWPKPFGFKLNKSTYQIETQIKKQNIMEDLKEELEMYRDLLKKLLELSYRIKWAEDETKIWLEAENLVNTFK